MKENSGAHRVDAGTTRLAPVFFFRISSGSLQEGSQEQAAMILPGGHMMRRLVVLLAMSSFVLLVFGGAAAAQEAKGKSLQLKDLPAAVQKTVQANLKGGEIKNIGKETEDNTEQFEIESVLNGKARDFNVDMKGNLLVMEEATTLDAIPAAAKAAILKKVGDGKLGAVETYSKPGQPMLYEAGYKDKAGKNHGILVKADGTETKGQQG
jgi:hypothetical protein